MVNVTSTYLTATQVMEILGVSRATAYKTIHELNEEFMNSFICRNDVCYIRYVCTAG